MRLCLIPPDASGTNPASQADTDAPDTDAPGTHPQTDTDATHPHPPHPDPTRPYPRAKADTRSSHPFAGVADGH